MKEADFYSHQSYGERAADNLAKWLGLPHLTTLDAVIILPLLPALVILISWWLPWEGWLWKRFPKIISGPYFLYCALVLWHFRTPWWAIFIAAAAGSVLSLAAILERGKLCRGTPP